MVVRNWKETVILLNESQCANTCNLVIPGVVSFDLSLLANQTKTIETSVEKYRNIWTFFAAHYNTTY
jgi:hypothetical protein